MFLLHVTPPHAHIDPIFISLHSLYVLLYRLVMLLVISHFNIKTPERFNIQPFVWALSCMFTPVYNSPGVVSPVRLPACLHELGWWSCFGLWLVPKLSRQTRIYIPSDLQVKRDAPGIPTWRLNPTILRSVSSLILCVFTELRSEWLRFCPAPESRDGGQFPRPGRYNSPPDVPFNLNRAKMAEGCVTPWWH